MIILFEVVLLGGLLAVASNPSPYYAALGLVVSAGAGCLVVTSGGASFLSLVLLLVYLGGMMVVFAYSAALAAEPYPEAWGSAGVISYLLAYLVLLWVWWVAGWEEGGVLMGVEMNAYLGDWLGVSVMYWWGGGFLLVVGWALLMTLFGVLEVVRGHYSGVLRAV